MGRKSSIEGLRDGFRATGSIITMAGLIMACAFSGMLFSSLEAISQTGFFVVVTALYDTFVARSILTPTIMSMFGEANWWPGPMYDDLCDAANMQQPRPKPEGSALQQP